MRSDQVRLERAVTRAARTSSRPSNLSYVVRRGHRPRPEQDDAWLRRWPRGRRVHVPLQLAAVLASPSLDLDPYLPMPDRRAGCHHEVELANCDAHLGLGFDLRHVRTGRQHAGSAQDAN